MAGYASDRRFSRWSEVFFPFLVVLLTLITGVSCSRDDDVRLPETSRLIGLESTALIRVEYARLYADSDPESPIITHARFGDIVPVLRRTPDSRWFAVRVPLGEGWVFHDDLVLYQTGAQARNAREQLRLREDS